jgi:uncharacterized protein (DUF433 family)
MQYVEQKDGEYSLIGTRVTLDSVVYCYLRGERPESIVESLPSLSLDQVKGAIEFYLRNRPRVDAYLVERREDFARRREEARRADPEFYAKLDAARRTAATRHS